MKRAVICILTLVLGLALSGCCMSHEWAKADCTMPETCIKCEKTKGEPLGHQWKEATCTTRKSCTICCVTEGEMLEHNFEEEVLRKDYVNADTYYLQTCKDCGKETERKENLEIFVGLDAFLMTPEDFAARFTSVMIDDQYYAYIAEDVKSGNLKMYMAQKKTNGKDKTVGEFALLASAGVPLQPEQRDEGNVLSKVQGTVKGKEQSLCAMLALKQTADPKFDVDDFLEKMHVLSQIGAHFNFDHTFNGRNDIFVIKPKSGGTYELILQAYKVS